MHHDDFATESNQTTTDPKRRYLCRHIFTDGHRCGSPALRRQAFCYYHRLARPSVSNEGRPTIFQMPPISDRPAIQNALFEILTRAAGGDLEYRHAAILFYGLQLASNNLNRMENAKPTTEPLVEEVFHDPDGGFLAPIAEYPEPPGASDVHPPNPVILSEAPCAESKDPDEPHTTETAPTIPPFDLIVPLDEPVLSLPKEPAVAWASRYPNASALGLNQPHENQGALAPAATSNDSDVTPALGEPLHDDPPTRELILAAVHAVAASNCVATPAQPSSLT